MGLIRSHSFESTCRAGRPQDQKWETLDYGLCALDAKWLNNMKMWSSDRKLWERFDRILRGFWVSYKRRYRKAEFCLLIEELTLYHGWLWLYFRIWWESSKRFYRSQRLIWEDRTAIASLIGNTFPHVVLKIIVLSFPACLTATGAEKYREWTCHLLMSKTDVLVWKNLTLLWKMKRPFFRCMIFAFCVKILVSSIF